MADKNDGQWAAPTLVRLGTLTEMTLLSQEEGGLGTPASKEEDLNGIDT